MFLAHACMVLFAVGPTNACRTHLCVGSNGHVPIEFGLICMDGSEQRDIASPVMSHGATKPKRPPRVLGFELCMRNGEAAGREG